jgi:hypothetical protein
VLRLPARALVALALSGCGTVGAYTTPRTLAPGDVSGGAAIELRPAPGTQSTSVSPSFIAEIRVGVVDRLDVGVRANDSDSLGIDAKLWLVKSPVFDLAFAGGFDTYLVLGLLESGTSSATRAFAGPIVGLNLTRTVSVTAWYAVTRLEWTGQSLGEIDGTGQWAGQGGLGIDIRITPYFAIHPGVALVYWGHNTDEDREWGVMYGVGFAGGRLPRFDDVGRR